MPFLNERRLATINRAVVTGRILPYIAVATLAITVLCGVAVRVLDPGDFESLGEALWWAAQTVTTVGYGDTVPASNGGRVIAVLVMIFGVTSVALITAIVTSAFIAWHQERLTAAEGTAGRLGEALERIEQRLDAIERRLP